MTEGRVRGRCRTLSVRVPARYASTSTPFARSILPQETVLLRTFSYRHEGEFARSILEFAGIESVLLTDDAGGMEMGLSFSNPAQLVVRERDREEAMEILEQNGMLDGDQTDS